MNKQILRLAVPNIISNLSVPLLGAVDTAIVGHLDEVFYLGAIAVGSIIFDFIFWGFGFLRMGTTGLVAQAYGKQDDSELGRILVRVISVALILSFFILLFQFLIIDAALKIVDASEEVERYTRIYFYIRIFSAPATLCLFGLNGWFLGMQNAKFPMIVTIVLNVLNIILNLIFVLRYDMNVSGVAWGSLIASYTALIVGFALFRAKYSSISLRFSLNQILKSEEILKFFQVNRDIFIRTLCLIFSYAFFVAKSAESGDVTLAANTILLQLWYIAAYGIDGFAFAAESLVGKFVGEQNREQLKEAIKSSLVWGLSVGVIGTIAYAIAGELILSIFTDKSEVLEAASLVLIWTILAPLINSVCFIWDGIYIGATSTVAMRNSMLIATVLIFVPVYFILEPIAGNHALWLAMISFMITRGITLSFLAKNFIYKPLISQA